MGLWSPVRGHGKDGRARRNPTRRAILGRFFAGGPCCARICRSGPGPPEPCRREPMEPAKVVSVADVLGEPRNDVHGTCAKAVLHQAAEAETSLFSVNPGEKLAAHLHTRTWDLFFVVSGRGEIRYRGPDGAGTVAMPERAF